VVTDAAPGRYAPEALAALVHAALGIRAVRVEADTYGATNAVYFVSLAGGDECVLRISPVAAREQMAAQVWAMEACAARGVLVPRVLAHDAALRTFSEPYLLMERLQRVPLPRAGLGGAAPAITVELGTQLAAIHSVEMEGFGPLVRSGAAYAGRYRTLREAALAELDGRLAGLGAEALPAALAREVRRFLADAEERGVLDAERAVLVHRDFQFRNALAADGRLTGVLDFDKAEAGDPVRDFAVLYPGDVALVRRGYEARRPGVLGDGFEERLAVYRLFDALERRWHLQEAGREDGYERAHGVLRQVMAAPPAAADGASV
jgi:aminoglycoside phosphotransferase (APT) family kinase protein